MSMYRFCFMLCVIFSACICIACSNPASVNVADVYSTPPDTDSIRSQLLKKAREIQWSEDVIYVKKNIETHNSFESGASIYPYLQGFASLDITQLPSGIIDIIQSLLTAGESPLVVFDELFTKHYVSLIFRYELQQLPEITAWRYGKPYISSYDDKRIFEVPVRVYFDDTLLRSYCDILFFFQEKKPADSSSAPQYYIEQVQFGQEQAEQVHE